MFSTTTNISQCENAKRTFPRAHSFRCFPKATSDMHEPAGYKPYIHKLHSPWPILRPHLPTRKRLDTKIDSQQFVFCHRVESECVHDDAFPRPRHSIRFERNIIEPWCGSVCEATWWNRMEPPPARNSNEYLNELRLAHGCDSIAREEKKRQRTKGTIPTRALRDSGHERGFWIRQKTKVELRIQFQFGIELWLDLRALYR